MRARPVLLTAAVLLLLGPAAACGDDEGDGATADSVDAQTSGDDFPPNDVDALAEVYDPMFEDDGLVLTRGALIDRSDGGYETSDTGTHLALYVEPTGEQTDEEYLDLLVDTTARVTPQVFSEWGSVETYDICQEPLPEVDDREEPVPVTQVEITREAAADIDFEVLDLAELLAIANTEVDPPVRVYVDPTLKELPAWQAAVDEAEQIRDERGIESVVAPGA